MIARQFFPSRHVARSMRNVVTVPFGQLIPVDGLGLGLPASLGVLLPAVDALILTHEHLQVASTCSGIQ